MILSIDSHSNQCLVALSNEGHLISSYLTNEQNKHDKFLAEFTNRILQDNNLNLPNIKAISIVSGPGSFTGLRIGFAFVKGLVVASRINLIKITSLEIYAYQAKTVAKILGKKGIFSIVPSTTNHYFIQEFNNESNSLSNIISVENSEISFHDNYLYVGNFDSQLYDLHKKLNLDTINPLMLAKISHEKYVENSFVEFDRFLPDYHFDFIPRT